MNQSNNNNKQERVELTEKLFNNFKIPSWAGKPQVGLHLDVLKDGKLIQKMMIDEKKCYFFGRNRQLCDFPIDHESCSRVHAALVWHKFVNRPFIIDLGSTHGTFIGHGRLEPHKPQQVPIDSEIHFGASSRIHIIREKPQSRQQHHQQLQQHEQQQQSQQQQRQQLDGKEGNYLGLPQTESELDNLTEFNTAQNRRVVTIIGSNDASVNNRRRRRGCGVTFAEEDDIINPEDVDPTVGRFRNLVYETFIPSKRAKLEDFDSRQHTATTAATAAEASAAGHVGQDGAYHMAAHLPDTGQDPTDMSASALTLGAFSVAAKLGLPLPNLAPDVDSELPAPAPLPALSTKPTKHASPTDAAAPAAAAAAAAAAPAADTPRKKKYAKEAWPGKKPGFLAAHT